ncbi:phosphatidylserine decarboxylase proenzyme, mitochondrial [Stomoxys calcitrans]|uniref:phosphatidylserine decarboxylase proenzyme, mitochondrial n=1 Tax=Stomoxys calcitrans TaxID=35570 RepID=UPI0027E2E0D8|nr:phosphatidylserine decarboxylase proenzyme, mitochondrial [Stomoxys calcitrans]XP_059219881.1 phosphatidylserine decarboxylase proenzyme, mitochondrial [Stomoxys calcitrans]
MVSYFIPRGRFLMKAGNWRQVHQKHQQQAQQQSVRWPLIKSFRQSFSQKVAPNDTKVEALIKTPNQFGKQQTRTPPSVNSKRQQDLQKQRLNIWLRWTGLLLKWAPVGICVFGAIEWQLHKQSVVRDQLPHTASEFQSKVYCSLPLRLLSRAWGWLAACYIPENLRPFIYGMYSNAFGVNIEEALYPDFKHYNSLSEFFTRPLKDGVRPIDAAAPLVSPADGKVLHFGAASKSLIEQVKGVNYSLIDFLGPASWVEGKTIKEEDYAESIKHKKDGTTNLYQCVIYLAPGDYHRFHSPTEWQAELRRHFTGELLSVSPKIATWLPGLFCLNERALYLGQWKYGFFSYTAVGATNVGSMQFVMDEQLKTNRWVGWKTRRGYEELALDEKKILKKGDLVGLFNMGSTIVLLFEAPSNFQFNIEAGQKIKVGEPLGHII